MSRISAGAEASSEKRPDVVVLWVGNTACRFGPFGVSGPDDDDRVVVLGTLRLADEEKAIHQELSTRIGTLPYFGVSYYRAALVQSARSGIGLDDLLHEVASQRLAGYLVGDPDRSADFDAKVVRHLRNAQFDSCAFAAATLRATAPALQGLKDHGISFVVIKGPGIANRVGGVAKRPFTDVDILVSPSTFAETRRRLEAMGYEQDTRTHMPRRTFDNLVFEAINLSSAEGGRVDLHQQIPPWRWGRRLTLERLLGASEDMEIAPGVNVPVASGVHNLLISALHIVSDKASPGTSAMPWQDVISLAEVCQPAEVAAEAKEVRLGSWLSWILSSIPPEERPSGLLPRLVGCPSYGRFRLKAMMRQSGLATSTFGQMVLRLPAGRAALVLGSVLVPTPDFLREKYGTTSHPFLKWYLRR